MYAVMSWSSNDVDQTTVSNDRVGERTEQSVVLIIQLSRLEHVSVTVVLSWVLRTEPQLEKRVSKVDSCVEDGAAGRAVLISAVSCDTILLTSLEISTLLVCWRTFDFISLDAMDTLAKV